MTTVSTPSFSRFLFLLSMTSEERLKDATGDRKVDTSAFSRLPTLLKRRVLPFQENALWTKANRSKQLPSISLSRSSWPVLTVLIVNIVCLCHQLMILVVHRFCIRVQPSPPWLQIQTPLDHARSDDVVLHLLSCSVSGNEPLGSHDANFWLRKDGAKLLVSRFHLIYAPFPTAS